MFEFSLPNPNQIIWYSSISTSQVRGSLARRALDEMEKKGLIKKVSAHRSQLIYTRMIKDEAEDAPEGGVVVEKKAPKQKMGKKAKKEAAEAEAAEAE